MQKYKKVIWHIPLHFLGWLQFFHILYKLDFWHNHIIFPPPQISVRFGDEVRYDNAMDMDEEAAMLEKYREARQHEQFPDEVDTPQDVSARVRFQKWVPVGEGGNGWTGCRGINFFGTGNDVLSVPITHACNWEVLLGHTVSDFYVSTLHIVTYIHIIIIQLDVLIGRT